jgi:hypothetical protein
MPYHPAQSMPTPGRSIPQMLEPIRRKLGVAHGMLDVQETETACELCLRSPTLEVTTSPHLEKNRPLRVCQATDRMSPPE